MRPVSVVARRTVDGEFAVLRQALLDDPGRWLPDLLQAAHGRAIVLQADTRFGHLSREAEVEVGASELWPASVHLPMTWRSRRASALFPVLKSRIRLYRLAGGSIRIELRGEYVPPAGLLGRAADAALLRSVAKATVEEFVEQVARRLADQA